jgi:hypothetical protein
VSLHDALGWQTVSERVLALPASERLFSSYFALLERTRRLEPLDPVFKELSAALEQKAETARAPRSELEYWVLRHTLCTNPQPLPSVAGFTAREVAAALDVFAHAAPWELSVLPQGLVSHLERLLPARSGVTVLHSALRPSSVLAPAVSLGVSVVGGDLASLAACVEPSSALICVFLPKLSPSLAPSASLVLSVAELLDDALSFETRLELAALLASDKPMLSV